MAIKVKPVFENKKYYCPSCDTELKWKHRLHCGLEFDWRETPKVNTELRVIDKIRYNGLKTSVIANKLSYGESYISHMLCGDSPMNDDLIEYLIIELEVYIRKLRELRKELKSRL